MGEEFQLFEERFQQFRIGRLDAAVFEFEGHRDIAVDGGQAAAHQDPLAIVLQAFPVHFPLDFGGAVEGGFDGAELFQQIARAFVADARRARDVVDRIAFERQQVRYLTGLHAHEFLDFSGVVPGVVFRRIQHRHLVGDQLQHVFVAGDDDDLAAGLRRLPAERADDIVGFETVILHDGNPQAFDEPLDVGNLLDQVRRRFGAVRFVLRVFGFAMGFAQTLEDGDHVLRLERFREFFQHVAENEYGFRGESGGGAHGRRAGPGARVVGPKDESVGVDQKKSGRGMFWRRRHCRP